MKLKIGKSFKLMLDEEQLHILYSIGRIHNNCIQNVEWSFSEAENGTSRNNNRKVVEPQSTILGPLSCKNAKL